MAFAIYFRFVDFPTGVDTLLSFGEFLLRSFTAPKSVINATSSVRRFHVDWGFHAGAFDTVDWARWKRALFLTVRSVPTQTPPMPFGLLVDLCGMARRMGDKGVTMAAFLTVAFHTLARASSLLAGGRGDYDHTRLPTLADVRSTGQGFDFNMKWDKTHQSSHAAFSVPLLPRGSSAACPVRAVRGLVRRASGTTVSGPLFATPVKGGQGMVLVPLTVVKARFWLRTLLQLRGIPERKYTLHSLRRGGCTSAYRGGAAVSELKSLGGWASNAVHLYHSQRDARIRAARALRAAPYQH